MATCEITRMCALHSVTTAVEKLRLTARSLGYRRAEVVDLSRLPKSAQGSRH